jgi:hypothetical protein
LSLGLKRLALLQLQAVAIPLFLTSLVYAGSFVNRLWCIASSWGGDDDEVGIGCAQRLVLQIQAALDDVMVWRNYVVVCSSPSQHCSVLLIILIIFCKSVTKDYQGMAEDLCGEQFSHK